jgi:hypothetical protein
MRVTQNRRRFLATFSSAAAAGLIGTGTSVAQDGPPETTTIRLARIPSICRAPQYMTEELLRSEGFTDVKYIPWRKTSEASGAVATGGGEPLAAQELLGHVLRRAADARNASQSDGSRFRGAVLGD